ncbi:MAG: peptide chain release factor N(5)-glutamine methyltransferase, partial [Burkholderiaceae bacterium]
PLPRPEARQLLEHVSGKSREWLIAHGDENASHATVEQFTHLIERRQRDEPLAYLTGHAWFFGRQYSVCPDVLIPRPETELLARYLIKHLPAGAHVLELGCGSGALCITLACERPDLVVTATDVEPGALKVATQNAATHGAKSIRFAAGSWFDAVNRDARFDAIVSNPPYIARGDDHLERDGLTYEPMQALVGGTDGLDAIRTIAATGRAYLTAGGKILLEHGYNQQRDVQTILSAANWHGIWSARDDSGNWRMTGASRDEAGCGQPGETGQAGKFG